MSLEPLVHLNILLAQPYFCGQHAYCTDPNSDLALREARANIEKYVMTVGVLERLADSVRVMEQALPKSLAGFTEFYQKEREGKKDFYTSIQRFVNC